MRTWFDTKNFRNALSFALSPDMTLAHATWWIARAYTMLDKVLPEDRDECEKELRAASAVIEARRLAASPREEVLEADIPS